MLKERKTKVIFSSWVVLIIFCRNQLYTRGRLLVRYEKRTFKIVHVFMKDSQHVE